MTNPWSLLYIPDLNTKKTIAAVYDAKSSYIRWDYIFP